LDFWRQLARKVALKNLFSFFVGKTSNHDGIITSDGNPVKRYCRIYRLSNGFLRRTVQRTNDKISGSFSHPLE